MSGVVTTVSSGVAGKCKKRDRNKKKCTRYKTEDRRLKAKLYALLRHIYKPKKVRNPGHHGDNCARDALARVKAELSVVHQKPVYQRLGMTI